MLLAVPALVMALNGRWAIAFGLFVVALITDFLDGLAAKKLDAKTEIGEQIDGWADSTLVIAGMTGLSAAGELSWWFTAAVLVLGAAIGSDQIVPAHTRKSSPVRKVLAVGCLFLAWITIGWFFAGLAFSWHWWYIPATLAVLAVSASLKRHRLRAWLGVGNQRYRL